ncbi:DUF2239 family protein [Dyella marensis]|jgi:hypothetical protein|uniref:DUF2239 domain-containing protein n=1 Tax=Dyella marensis TaxID=500610 RepID=A0A1I2ISS6_9GAMM|nr:MULTISPECIES: DUF2239 family protein [Dyella]SFF44770.1 hypothetical protein SAMN02799615_03613 [Dyella marensis]
MHPSQSQSCTAFDGHRLIASGSLREVASATKRAIDAGAKGPVLVFDDQTSLPVEIDFRGSQDDVLSRLGLAQAATETAPRGPGRPRLGVVAREITLLPRHWEWLAEQPGGASATLRRLVEDARRSEQDRARRAGEALDRFMQAMAGDLPHYEEASRAYWRGERDRFDQLVETWPADVRDHARRLAAAAWNDADAIA